MSTIINEEKPDDFIKYMFEKEPKPKDSIQLECPDIVEVKIYIYISLNNY
jgi:hypothetical protein